MPVHLRSITGKVDYDVEQVIRDLVFAINQLETRPLPEAPVVPAAQEVPEVRAESQRAVVDRQDIDDLEADVGVVTDPPPPPPPPPPPGPVPPNHLDLVVALDTVSPGLIDTPDAFTQQIASTLHNGGTIGSVTVAADTNWGRVSVVGLVDLVIDLVAYMQPNGILNPYSIVIIQNAGIVVGPAIPAWQQLGLIGDTWVTP